MRSRACAAALASTVLAVTALGSCASDEAGGDPPAPSASGSSSPAETSETPSTEGSDDPTDPDAATGEQVRTQVLTYRLPADIDWDVSMGGTAAQWFDEKTMGGWSVFQFEHNEGEPVPLAQVAKSQLTSTRRTYPEVERLDNRDVNGVEGWVLEHHGKNSFGRSEFFYQFGAVHGTWWTTFKFSFPKDDARTRKVIDSVLASVEWKDF